MCLDGLERSASIVKAAYGTAVHYADRWFYEHHWIVDRARGRHYDGFHRAWHVLMGLCRVDIRNVDELSLHQELGMLTTTGCEALRDAFIRE